MHTGREIVEPTPVTEIQRSSGMGRRAAPVRMHHLVECGWLICLFAIVAAFCVRPTHSADEDLWWHLRIGTWILQHGVAPTQDFFGSPTAGQPWIAYTWL